MAWRGHEASPPASPPRAGYEQAGQDGLDDLAVAALATLPPQKAASILTKLRNKGGNVRNPSAYVVRSCVEIKIQASHAVDTVVLT